MSITLNAFPLQIPDVQLKTRVIPYDKEMMDTLRTEHPTNILRRQGNSIQIFSFDNSFPIEGKDETVKLKENMGVLCFLVKDSIVRSLAKLNKHPIGFNPIELVSEKPDDNILAPILGADYPFQIYAKFKINTRIIRERPHLLIDCTTRKTVSQNCLYFLNNGFDLLERSVVTHQADGYRRFEGYIDGINGKSLRVRKPTGETYEIAATSVYLEADLENFDDYILYTHGKQKDAKVDKIRETVSLFNAGNTKASRIETLKRFFQTRGIVLCDGTSVSIGESEDIQRLCGQLDKPVYVFNDNGQENWAEKGLTQYGPYTKRTFDRNDPSVCVICAQHDKGRVEQFVRKFLKGISSSKYFCNGLEGKFSIGTSKIEVFTVATDDINAYKSAIEAAIQKKSDDGGRWDLALVQVRQSFKKRNVNDNPYYISKSLFYLHQVPVQDFTIELLNQTDYSLGYSLNNMALACYAKMSGVPWLLKSSPTLSHELVIGIGSANIGDARGSTSQRIMGITTVFSGDGSYIVSNTSKAVTPDAYCDALTSVLADTIQKIQKRMNWQKGDTIRLIFHAQVKKFSKDEISAVRTVIERYKDYQVEYAFLKISEDHGLHMFDTTTAGEKKGKLAPPRGKTFKLAENEMLLYLIGQRELRQDTDGHPRGLTVSVHKDSTFHDITYLSNQLYSFASHSWRSYFPNPMPVTITYSDLIASNLGWLNQLPGWNDAVMIGKIGQSQWFL